MAFFELLGSIGNIASAGASLYNIISPPKYDVYNNPALMRMMKANQMAELFSKWAAQPNSRAFKNLEGIERERIQSGFIQSVQDIMRSDRAARARGDAGFGVNPERRDEAKYRAVLEANEASKSQARQMARDYLLAGATGQAAAAQGYGGAATMIDQGNLAIARDESARRDALAMQMGSLPETLQQLFSLFQGRTQPTRGGFGAAMGARSGAAYNTNPYYSRIQGTGGVY